MNYAWDRSLQKPPGTIYRIPIRLDDCDVSEDLYELNSKQWNDYFGEKKDETYKKLLMALQRRLEQRERLDAKEHVRAEALAKKQAEERELREREELAQKIAEEKARQEEGEKLHKETAEGARLEAEEKIRKEAEQWARRKAEEVKAKENKAVQLESFGDISSALNLYYEIQNIDPTYPGVDVKINEIEKEIRSCKEKAHKEAEELALKIAKEKARQENEEQLRKETEKKSRREAAEKVRKETEEKVRQKVDQVKTKANNAIRLEALGNLSDALNLYYEIRIIDPSYPNIDIKISELEKKFTNLFTPSMDNKVLQVIVCFFIPLLAVYMKKGTIDNAFWINVVLTILGGLPGVLHALYVVLM